MVESHTSVGEYPVGQEGRLSVALENQGTAGHTGPRMAGLNMLNLEADQGRKVGPRMERPARAAVCSRYHCKSAAE